VRFHYVTFIDKAVVIPEKQIQRVNNYPVEERATEEVQGILYNGENVERIPYSLISLVRKR
jgi:hypothetical protein